ncbi:hypothetical protein QNI19_08415 [Cytophagaceae bacterium DM2B3-1]|uniref:Uncharacterized protein n=1 Tax=Xanthocytophaga flava TaxID=3048013 RepID=A0ABT7CIT0_9BACT|nr:hypothetical protein [Xanthocytophaga flavus]MDJ1492952.1 hypothetical protein [Xanthocytophaga flavus]
MEKIYALLTDCSGLVLLDEWMSESERVLSVQIEQIQDILNQIGEDPQLDRYFVGFEYMVDEIYIKAESDSLLPLLNAARDAESSDSSIPSNWWTLPEKQKMFLGEHKVCSFIDDMNYSMSFETLNDNSSLVYLNQCFDLAPWANFLFGWEAAPPNHEYAFGVFEIKKEDKDEWYETQLVAQIDAIMKIASELEKETLADRQFAFVIYNKEDDKIHITCMADTVTLLIEKIAKESALPEEKLTAEQIVFELPKRQKAFQTPLIISFLQRMQLRPWIWAFQDTASIERETWFITHEDFSDEYFPGIDTVVKNYQFLFGWNLYGQEAFAVIEILEAE